MLQAKVRQEIIGGSALEVIGNALSICDVIHRGGLPQSEIYGRAQELHPRRVHDSTSEWRLAGPRASCTLRKHRRITRTKAPHMANGQKSQLRTHQFGRSMPQVANSKGDGEEAVQ